jgi:hypothetical protein
LDTAESPLQSAGFDEADGSQDSSSSGSGAGQPGNIEAGSQVLEGEWMENSDESVPAEVLEPAV